MSLKKNAKIYFMGIGGTGMASVAGLCHEAGFEVSGSDTGLYPPTSLMLERLKLDVRTPYDAQNISSILPDLIVVANCLSRGNVEIEYMLEKNIPKTSFPALLGEHFLRNSVSTVVTGTHGKTTTTSLISHMLEELGQDPSFMIGGLPQNFKNSFKLGKGPFFVIEGDEYDTAFFDKGPKFLHYCPKHLVLNNLEFDHADIYNNLEEIEIQFKKVTKLVPSPDRILANVDDPGIAKLILELGIENDVTRVATKGESAKADTRLAKVEFEKNSSGIVEWIVTVESNVYGMLRFRSPLRGYHNMANITQAIAVFGSFERHGDLDRKINPMDLVSSIESFKGVKRRLDLLGSFEGTDIYEDFAHHPTAVQLTIEGLRAENASRRLLVAFEPRSATQRRNVFQDDYSKTLALADRIYLGACPVDTRIDEKERMNTKQLQTSIGANALSFERNEDLLEQLIRDLKPGDAVIFMSSGPFSGIQHEMVKRMRS